MKDYKFDLALSNYRSLTGDYDTQFESVEDIYVAIQNAVDNDGDATIIRPLNTDITENGTYEFKKQGNIDAYEPVTINVNIDNEAIYNQGYNVGYEEGVEIGHETGYNLGFGEGEANQKSKLVDVEFTGNGFYEREDGYKTVNVNIDSSIFFNEGFVAGKVEGYNLGFGEGEANQKSKLEDIEITSNGTYSKEDGYKNVTVKVSSDGFDFSIIGYDSELSKELNGDFQADIDYSKSLYDKYNGVLSGNVSNLFKGDTNLVYCPNFNTSGVTNMYSMFEDCANLQTIPQLDTSNVTNMSNLFEGCTNLQTIPQLDTSKVGSMDDMFYDCNNLQTIPQLDTSKLTNMMYTFSNCNNLQTIPQLDTSKVTTMLSAFSNCRKITTIPQLDTSNVTTMNSTFNGCESLISIPLLDTSKVTSAGSLCYNCKSLTDVGGFKNLGMQKSLAIYSGFNTATNLSHDSIMNIINNLYDRAAAGYSTVALPLGSTNLGKISDDEKAIATNKGWTLS